MNDIYQVTVRGRRLESRDLRKLLARAVAEKRSIDERLRLSVALHNGRLPGSAGTLAGDFCHGGTVGR
jgi:hypothetical protein